MPDYTGIQTNKRAAGFVVEHCYEACRVTARDWRGRSPSIELYAEAGFVFVEMVYDEKQLPIIRQGQKPGGLKNPGAIPANATPA